MRRVLRTVVFRGTAGIAAAARHAAPPARHVGAEGLRAPPDDAPIPARCGGFVRWHEVRPLRCCIGGTPGIPDAERQLRYVDLRIGADRRTNGPSRAVAGALPSSSGPGARAGSSCRSGMEGRPAPWGSRRGLVAVRRYLLLSTSIVTSCYLNGCAVYCWAVGYSPHCTRSHQQARDAVSSARALRSLRLELGALPTAGARLTPANLLRPVSSEFGRCSTRSRTSWRRGPRL